MTESEREMWRSAVAEEDIDFSVGAKEALLRHRIPGLDLILWGSVLTLVALGVWASIAEIDEVTKGQGKIIPSSSIQTIQNLEGGILVEQMVKEGQFIKKGDVIARLDDTLRNASYEEEIAQQQSLQAALSRLESEANGWETIQYPPAILAQRPDLVERENELFEKKKVEIDKQINVVNRSLELAKQELAMTIPLVREQIISKVDLLRIQREVNELEGKQSELWDKFQRGAMESYNETKNTLETLEKSLKGRKDTVERTMVRSPVSGTINKWHKTTIGGVVQPGEDIVDIVPHDGTLLVEAKIRPQDIAFLRPGQPAVVKLTAYDFSIYGGLDGVLEHISADTIYDEIDNQHYYQIKVRNEGQKKGKNGKEFDIIPGMVAEVDVLTGRRTVMQYLTKPFHRMRFNALKER
ncbi:MAG: HlyD family type I secretion periplasmic adaptor subunit [Verrucomicrobiales bacterium]|nr:HlyD family type I secretion periplasmic adaptor subunit [Verrucomicrobiales bacterium]